MAFNDRLKEARLAKNYTQEYLAELIGVAKSTYTGYEKGNREPNMRTISKIMNVLNIDANFLWQDEMESLGGNPVKLKYDEMKRIEKYRDLDTHGREIVDFVLDREHKRSISEMDKVVSIEDVRAEYIAPVAACPDETATNEEREADDNMMKNDSEWK